MIGTVDIRINAQYPNTPLNPVFSFVGSPSTIVVQNIPKQIGDWHITSVYIQAEYPDNTIKTTICENVLGAYIGTIQPCSVSGSSSNGLTVYADGIDEKKNPVTGYVLGKADIFILKSDSSINPGTTSYQVRFYLTQPSNPNIGDTYINNGCLMIWTGTEWTSTGTSITKVSQLENDVGYQTQQQVQALINNAGFLTSLNYWFEEINGNDNTLYDNTINTYHREKSATDSDGTIYHQVSTEEDPTGQGFNPCFVGNDWTYCFGFADNQWSLFQNNGSENWEWLDAQYGDPTDSSVTFVNFNNFTVYIVNSVVFDGLNLPQFEEGKARDFLFYLDTDCDTVSITVSDTDHDENWQHTYPIVYVSDDESIFTFETGKTIVAFSEISPHTFLVNKQKLNVVTQSQGG